MSIASYCYADCLYVESHYAECRGASSQALGMDYIDSILCIGVRYDEAGLNNLSRTLIVKVRLG